MRVRIGGGELASTYPKIEKADWRVLFGYTTRNGWASVQMSELRKFEIISAVCQFLVAYRRGLFGTPSGAEDCESVEI